MSETLGDLLMRVRLEYTSTQREQVKDVRRKTEGVEKTTALGDEYTIHQKIMKRFNEKFSESLQIFQSLLHHRVQR
jgi:hypothetical protein